METSFSSSFESVINYLLLFNFMEEKEEIKTIDIAPNSEFFNYVVVRPEINRLLTFKRLFPNYKELSESLGALFAFGKFVIEKLDNALRSNSEIVCYVIGDGYSPRTAATF